MQLELVISSAVVVQANPLLCYLNTVTDNSLKVFYQRAFNKLKWWTLTLSLPQSSIDDLVFLVFTSNFSN